MLSEKQSLPIALQYIFIDQVEYSPEIVGTKNKSDI